MVSRRTVSCIVTILLPWLAAAAGGVSTVTTTCPSAGQTVLTLQSAPFPSLPGQLVTLRFFIQPVTGIADPMGTVQLADGLTDLGTFPIALGQATTTRTFVSAGTRTLHASYSGDANYCSGQLDLGHLVDRFVPAVIVSSSAATSIFGGAITLTAQLNSPAPAGVAAPTGQVQFFDGAAPIGSAALSGLKASLAVSSLPAGSRQITATYSGDANNYSVRSDPIVQTVNRAPTATTLAADSSTSQVKLTATVAVSSSPSAAAVGTVQFADAATDAILGSATLTPGAASASLTLPAAQIALPGGHSIVALYSGSDNLVPSTSNALAVPGVINSAGADSPDFAPEELVSIFGTNFASGTFQNTTIPLPSTLGGATVTIADSAGVTGPAGLYLVSPEQINFVMPAGAARGTAVVSVTGALPIRVNIGAVAPGLFPVAQFTGTDTVYLILFGTGIRGRSAESAVTVTIAGRKLPVSYAGAQSQYPGLDQVNVALPAELKGAGKVPVTVTVDGRVSNTISVTIG